MRLRKLLYVCITLGFLCLGSVLSYVNVKAANTNFLSESNTPQMEAIQDPASPDPSYITTNDTRLMAEQTLHLTHTNLVKIGAFQITQVIQTISNTVPLVRDQDSNYKRFAIRVAAQSLNGASLPVVIQATLTYSGSELNTTLVTTNTRLSQTMPSLDSEDSITILHDPSHLEWQKWDADEIRVSIQIYSDENLPYSDENLPYPDKNRPHLLDETDVITYLVKTTRTPQIFFFPQAFPDGISPTMSMISSTIAAGFVKGILPAVDSGDFYRITPYTPFYCPVVDVKDDKLIGLSAIEFEDDYGDIKVVTPSEMCAIFHNLYSIRNGLVAYGFGPDSLTTVYGWTEGNPMSGTNGFADLNGSVAFGNTELVRGQRTFAHEIMHNLGFVEDEKKLSIGSTGWDVDSTLLSAESPWAQNQVTTTYKSADLLDIMAQGKETTQAWIAPDTYITSIERLDPTERNLKIIDAEIKSGEHLSATVIHDFCVGVKESGDGYYAYPFPLSLWQWTLPYTPPPPGTAGVFTATFTTEFGDVFSTQIDGRVGTDPSDGSPDIIYGFLHATVPYSATLGSIASVNITDPEGNIVPIYNRETSSFDDSLTNPRPGITPTITIISPLSGTIESTEFEVSWRVEGATPAQLRKYEFQVLYSHNDSKIWVPLAVNIPGFLAEVSISRDALCTTDSLLEGELSGILRVAGSDGFNTGFADVRVSLDGTQNDYCERGPIRQSDVPLRTSPPPRSNIAPYTGKEVADATVLQNRPIFICIGNDPVGRSVHYGLSKADLVYEYIVDDFTTTRLAALYHSQNVERVGPVRSARMPNIWMTQMYDGVLACSGGNDDLRYLLKNEVGFPFLDADIDDPSSSVYFSSFGLDYRTRLQGSTDGVRRYLHSLPRLLQNEQDATRRAKAEEMIGNLSLPWQRSAFSYSEEPPVSDVGPANVIQIPYPGGNSVEWRYDAERNQYMRFQDGQPHIDNETGNQIVTDNVIVILANHTLTDQKEDSLGTKSVDVELYGFGDFRIFRDGLVYAGTWRADDESPPRWLGPGEQTVPLKPGQSWIQVVRPADIIRPWPSFRPLANPSD